MNLVLKPWITSIVRSLMVAAATYLVAHGAWTSEQGQAFVSQNVDAFAALALYVIPLVWSWLQKKAQARLVVAAHDAHPMTSLELIAAKAKDRARVPLSFLGTPLAALLLVVGLPISAAGQGLVAQGTRLALAQQPTPSPSGIAITDQQYKLGIGIGFLAVNVMDTIAACRAVQQKTVTGVQVNTPTLATVPAACQKIILEKVGIVGAGWVAFDKLWSAGHKWEALATLVGATAGTLASLMTSIYEKPTTGDLPNPAGRSFSVRFAVTR